MMLNLKHILKARLYAHEHRVKQALSSGQLRTCELDKIAGKIEELKIVLELLAQSENEIIPNAVLHNL